MHVDRIILSWPDVLNYSQAICRQIDRDQWCPDYVVGLTRGGLAPAVLISQYLSVPMHTLKVSLRDDAFTESNCWMAEDAFGYETHDPMISSSGRKNILIVDDINDSGATLNWIRQDWQSSCLPHSEDWNDVWGHNVKFAVLVNNEASGSWREPDFVGRSINKLEKDVWVDFPWENWWIR
jgi:hypoxanthine phosphoribosyltransferase